jgi:hypothetical protein
MASFNKVNVKKLYLPTAHGTRKGHGNKPTLVTATASELNIMDGVTSTAAELNIMDGVTATYDELNLLEGSSVANATASVALILDANGSIVTATNVGAANTGITAYEYGDGINHVTRLTTTALAMPNVPGADAECVGVLLYTFPATGDIIIKNATYDAFVTIDGAGNNAETPEFALGTVIGTGDFADTSNGGTFEDIMIGTAGTADGSTATELTLEPTAGSNFIQAKGTNKVHFNIAETWSATSTATSVTGTFFIEWSIRVI